MAELTVCAQDQDSPDEEHAYRKGDIVSVYEDGGIDAPGIGPPGWIIVKIPGVTVEQVMEKRESWEQIVDYEIVAQNAALDGARFRLFTTDPGVANEYGLTYAKVGGWIEKWGGVLVSEDLNEVRFDITIENIYKSEAFWEVSPATFGVVISETGYDQGTGVHTASIDCSASTVPSILEKVVRRVEAFGATVTGIAGSVVSVELYRDTVRSKFMEALGLALHKVVRKRRYYFSEADVDAVVAQGGVISVTPAQAAAKILDKAV